MNEKGNETERWRLMPRVSIAGEDGENWRQQPWHPMHDFVTVAYLNALESQAATDAQARRDAEAAIKAHEEYEISLMESLTHWRKRAELAEDRLAALATHEFSEGS